MEKDLIINGVKVHYAESGNPDGKPVLLLHGWGCTHKTLASIAAILEQKMHVYSIDFPGHGMSDEPPTIWGIEDYTSMTEQFCDMLGIDSPVLLGHSFGGRVSILFSSRRKTSEVLLVDAAGVKPKRKPKYYLKVYTYKTLKHLLPIIFGKEKGGKMLDAYRGKRGSADYNSASPVMRGILSKVVNEDLKSVMPDIKSPTLLIWGENDTATPISDARIMEKLIPDAGLVSFAGCGHYSFLDNPVGFRSVVKEFLKHYLN